MIALYEILRVIKKKIPHLARKKVTREVLDCYNGNRLIIEAIDEDISLQKNLKPLIEANYNEICFTDSKRYNPEKFSKIVREVEIDCFPILPLGRLTKVKEARANLKFLFCVAEGVICVMAVSGWSAVSLIHGVSLTFLAFISYAILFASINALEYASVRRIERKICFIDSMIRQAFPRDENKKEGDE